MKDDDNTTPTEPKDLPPQTSPQDTSNWDDRPFTAPDGRIHIETFKPKDSNK